MTDAQDAMTYSREFSEISKSEFQLTLVSVMHAVLNQSPVLNQPRLDTTNVQPLTKPVNRVSIN